MSSFAHGGSSSSSSLYCSAAFALISLGVVCHTRHKKAQAQASERVIEQASKELCEYTGSCHCKRVKFSFTASKHLIIWDCNCSVCFMKKNAHVVVPQSAFKLLSGEDALSLYTFNTHVAKHYFCKYCGVQSYYVSVFVVVFVVIVVGVVIVLCSL